LTLSVWVGGGLKQVEVRILDFTDTGIEKKKEIEMYNMEANASRPQ